jgi:hypothetical protein
MGRHSSTFYIWYSDDFRGTKWIFLAAVLSRKTSKKDGMWKMAKAFYEDMKAIDPKIGLQFGRKHEASGQSLLRNTNLIPVLESRHRID